MSMPKPAALLTFLQENGFLTPTQVQELGGAAAADGRTLASELLGRNWLTAFQANHLLQGRGGELLLGPYRLVDRLGEGGMGQVFKALHVSMGRLVALKVIPRDRVSNPVAVARFYLEVRAVAKLSHPNIVIAHDVSQAGETHFLAMEHIDGIDLARLVQQSGPLAIPQACDYIRQAALGLHHAHEKGLVHRDVKPGNLMVTRPQRDQLPVIKILDFGLARLEGEAPPGTRLTKLGTLLGTVDYMAPEQAENARTVDIRADVYSLGCSLFYLLTGQPPFPGELPMDRLMARLTGQPTSIRSLRPEVADNLERVLGKMLARDPGGRYQTPSGVAAALAPLCQAGTPQPATGGLTASIPVGMASTEEKAADFRAIQAAPEPIAAQRLPERMCSRRDRFPTAKLAITAGVLAVLTAAAVGVHFAMRRQAPDPSKEAQATLPLPGGRPEALDCTRPGGASASDVRGAQGAWAKYLGRQVEETVELAGGVTMNFLLIPPGKFLMGSPQDENGHGDYEMLHEVTLTESFDMGKTEVTQAQYKALGLENPSKFKGDDLPVEMVSWTEARDWAEKLTKERGDHHLYRLPTEAEWEYSCRGGRSSSQPFGVGDGRALSSDTANIKGNKESTCPVASYPANALGLHDMHGNVWEWCSDWNGLYPRSPILNPTGPENGLSRVTRGGSWTWGAAFCRASFRALYPPPFRRDDLGFRLARSVPSAGKESP